MTATITCPRCGREVGLKPEARNAHAVGCVRIPAKLPKGWGVKTRKVRSRAERKAGVSKHG
jgi:hypothetical protein